MWGIIALLGLLQFLLPSNGLRQRNQNDACINKPLILTGDSGVVTSYNFPNKYANDLDCAWKISAAPGKRILLQFEVFQVEGHGYTNCYDVVTFYEGESESAPKMMHLCGLVLPKDKLSQTNNLYITFTSDTVMTYKGFKINWQAIDAADYTIPPYNGECGKPVIPHKIGNGRGMTLPDGRIVGGQEAEPGSWPWQADFRIRGISHVCGGTLIHPEYIVSAAHCFEKSPNPSSWKAILGKHQKYSDPLEQEIALDKVWIHSYYNDAKMDNDIALIKLATPAVIDNYTMPVCLPPQDFDVPHDTMCYTTGWGKTKDTGYDDVLKQAMVPIIQNTKCNDYYPNNILPSMVCAGYHEGGHDACQGDSGGPLVCNNNGVWELIGITSWGYDCALATKPGVYARAAKYINWIENVMRFGIQ